VALLVIGAAYEIVTTRLFGRALGKLATHVRVVAADGAPVTWAQAAVRWAALGGVATAAATVFRPLGFVWGVLVAACVLLHGLGPHDYAASTKVITDIARPASPGVAPPTARTTKERTTR
jgi:uncharacterized RDD family membrane protein YckC